MLRHSLLALVTTVTLCVFSSGVARADGPTPGEGHVTGSNKTADTTSISVQSNARGVTIFISVSQTSPGQAGTAPTSQVSSGPTQPACTATPMNIGNATSGLIREGLAAHPDTMPWGVTCSGGYFGIAWVPTNAPAAPNIVVTTGGTPAVDPAAIAASVLGIVPLPPIGVGASPGMGLVALPSWFWVDGYDGATLRGSRSLGLVTVEVEITPQSYHWIFGDGADLQTTSLGKAYPTESDVQHKYEQSSLSTGGTYDLRMEITFNARYRVNGGAWLVLPPVTQAYARSYPVQQLQSVLTANH